MSGTAELAGAAPDNPGGIAGAAARGSLGAGGATRLKHANAGIAMSVATFAMAATSGIQALLYLSSFGVNGRTDGFFVAFALYAIFGLFSQSLRVSSVPLLVGDRPRMTRRQFAATLALIAGPVAIATIPLAGPLSHLLAPGLAPEHRAVTQDALPLLGIAMVLQLAAAGGATVLAVHDRFGAVAVAYGGGALAGLVAYLVAAGPAGELSLGWSMLAMACVTSGAMAAGFRGLPSAAPGDATRRRGRLLGFAVLIFGRTFVYLAFNALYLITLAMASGFETGAATVLSYAYLYASYLVAGTGFSLGLSRIADMRRAALAEWRAALVETVPQGFRYSMLLVAPALAVLVAAGAPLIGEALPASFSPADVETLRTFAALLVGWTVGALLVNLVLPAMFALGHGRLVNALAPALVLVHVGATATGGALFGVDGVVGAAALAPLCFACLLIGIGARGQARALGAELAGDALRFLLPAAGAYGLGAVAGAALPAGPGRAVCAALVGTAFYLLALRVAAPRQWEVLAGRLRPLGAQG